MSSKIRTEVVDFIDAKNDSKVLDIATGTGKQAFAFAKGGYDVIGIDLSEDILKVANRGNKYENITFEVADAANMPFKNNQFDVSCISFALHDMPLSIGKKVLDEMVRVTKTQGNITVVDYALPKNKIIRYLVYHFLKSKEGKNYVVFVKSDLHALFTEMGIKLEKEISVLFGAVRMLKGTKQSF
ncbi:MAG: class I SAM-dependent methyltransferase [Atribacterota bacterium]